jgi:V8-like Glu-specific endopeptidase
MQMKGQHMGRVRRAIAIVTVGSFVFAALVLPGVASAKPPAGTQKSKVFGGTPTVGALFENATSGKHFCTASVVASPGGNVLITAAHCIQGNAKGLSFAPGFHDGTAPFGRWKVTGAYFDPAWISEGNTTRDFAFLTVAPKTLRGIPTDIQTVTGANVLATKPTTGESVTVPAYPDGQAKVPITCTAKVYYEGIYPAFNCNPYIGGTSGSPWLAPTPEGVMVVGLIAGLHQGGCYTYTSYSPPLGSDARAVYNRAVAGAKPEIGPDPGSDNCSTGL